MNDEKDDISLASLDVGSIFVSLRTFVILFRHCGRLLYTMARLGAYELKRYRGTCHRTSNVIDLLL